MTDCLNQRDRRPVVNTSSLHCAKTRAKTKQEKHHKNKTQKHRVTTDMCGITNSSTCFFSRSTTMGCATVQPYIRPPFIGPSGKISQLKNVSPLPPIVGAPSFKTNHLWAEVPFPERYVWPRAVTSHHPILTGVFDEPLQTFCHCHSNQERRYETSTYAVCRTTWWSISNVTFWRNSCKPWDYTLGVLYL